MNESPRSAFEMEPRPETARCTSAECAAMLRAIRTEQHESELRAAVMNLARINPIPTRDQAVRICKKHEGTLVPSPPLLPDGAATHPSNVNYFQPMLDAGFNATGLRDLGGTVGLAPSISLIDYLSEPDTTLEHIAVFVDGLTWANTVAFPRRWRVGQHRPRGPPTSGPTR